MLYMKTEPSTPADIGTLTPSSPSSVQTLLDLWGHLASSPEMDKESRSVSLPSTGSGRGGRPNRAQSASVPSAQASAASSSSSNTVAAQGHIGQVPGWHPQQPSVPPSGPGNLDEVARALRTIQEAYPFLVQSVAHHQQNNPRDPNQFPSAVAPQLLSQPPWPLTQPSASHGAESQYMPDFGTLFPPDSNHPLASAPYPTPHISSPFTTAPGESSFQAFTLAQTQESAPVDAEASAEEKRKRNTAASARFRVKKKVQTLNLERTVSDLTGRVDELEQEAADLRRENGWLKEIVMLKSGRARGVDLLAGPPQSRPSSSQDSQRDGDEESEEGGSVSDKGKGKRSDA